MASNRYISFELEGMKLDLDPEGQVPQVDYALEDEDNFEQKKGAESFNLTFPPTPNNQAVFNSLQNPSVLDATADELYSRPRAAKYIANGHEILSGKFFFERTVMRGDQILRFEGKLYGLNGDWVIDLKEKTLYDFLNPGTHYFNLDSIVGSWVFDGRNEGLDYVYAPVRYQKRFGEYPAATEEDPAPKPADDNVLKSDMKPALSVYWILYRAFKSLGYRISSPFMDSDYFRRLTMPWTWGGFDYLDDSRWEPLKFLANMPAHLRVDGDYGGYPNLNVLDNNPGAYDNSDTYTWHGPAASIPNLMVWKYPATLNLGKLRANFSTQLFIDYRYTQNSSGEVKVQWFKNGSMVIENEVSAHDAPTIGTRQGVDTPEDFFEVDIEPGDWIGCRVYLHLFESGTGIARVNLQVQQFTLNFMRLTEGSVINFQNYPKFKNYKVLDLLRGIVDTFNLQVNTNPITKEVFIIPTHGYKLDGADQEGYYNRKQLDFSQRRDYLQEDQLELFSDYDREFVLKWKDDGQDGGLKKVQDRNQTVIGTAKYVLPERFKTGKRELENRFFSPTMHCEFDQFKYITGVAPQLITILPENIANTSSAVSENTFQPKLAWYKGRIPGVGGWKFNGVVYSDLPYLFSVNYKPGGHLDPVLSYADQKINDQVGQGLLKKFFWQRLAIFRNGRRWSPVYLRLNNNDVTNYLHRESIVLNGMECLLTSIKGYDPIAQESAPCTMWVFAPVNQRDLENTYPSIESIQNSTTSNSFDVKYWPHKLLYTDIL